MLDALLSSAFVVFIFQVFRMATPLCFAAVGGFFSERSGVTNIALEGLMLLGAFFAATIAYWAETSLGFTTLVPWIGFFGGMLASGLVAALYALFVINFQANQIVTATAINMLAVGTAPVLAKLIFDQTGGTESIEHHFFYAEPTIFCIVLVAVVYFWFRRTRSGLWLQFAGEHPHALETCGISVLRMRWTAVILSGMLAGLGGASLSLFMQSQFTRDMSAGRGFMALAALIMGKWHPIYTALACLFFAAAQALSMRFQGYEMSAELLDKLSFLPDILLKVFAHPGEFFHMFPYVVTILVLAGVVGSSRPPAALGAKYDYNH